MKSFNFQKAYRIKTFLYFCMQPVHSRKITEMNKRWKFRRWRHLIYQTADLYKKFLAARRGCEHHCGGNSRSASQTWKRKDNHNIGESACSVFVWCRNEKKPPANFKKTPWLRRTWSHYCYAWSHPLWPALAAPRATWPSSSPPASSSQPPSTSWTPGIQIDKTLFSRESYLGKSNLKFKLLFFFVQTWCPSAGGLHIEVPHKLLLQVAKLRNG